MPLAPSYRGLVTSGTAAPADFGGVRLTFGYRSQRLAKNSTWQAGPLVSFPPSATDSASRRLVVPFAGVVRSVSMLTVVDGVKSEGGLSTVWLANAKRGVEVQVFEDLELDPFATCGADGEWRSMDLAMPVAKFDELCLRVRTPAWSIEPVEVMQLFDVCVERRAQAESGK